MSIATDNRVIALKALECFNNDVKGKENKPYLNAVQKSLLLLGAQGLRRTLLYITSQMGKGDTSNGGESEKKSNPFGMLYNHLADFSEVPKERFQYAIIKEYSNEKIVRLEARIALFLLCLKRLAAS